MPCFPHGALRSPTSSCILIGFWRGKGLRLLNAKYNLALAAPGHLPACACMQLLTDMIADPVVKNRVMIDVMNEPDVRGIKCAWTLEHVPPAWRDGLLRTCALTCSGLNMQRDSCHPQRGSCMCVLGTGGLAPAQMPPRCIWRPWMLCTMCERLPEAVALPCCNPHCKSIEALSAWHSCPGWARHGPASHVVQVESQKCTKTDCSQKSCTILASAEQLEVVYLFSASMAT